MPYIKRIELVGFKSFGRPVKMTLDKGFTVITGPNGSGKSNIVDAILFALGELSTRRLRAENASKLIFNGSEKEGLERARRAKVTIQFDNSDGRIPVDTSTVTISREVNRSGQSIYRLNGRKISRVHVMEILSMAGISSASQNIILQGTITRLTDISPIERRKIIEELVGIAQYDAEKAEAEEKLQAAEISIRTAMGRIDEVRKRVEDLERERNDLLRFNFLKGEIARYEAIKLSHDIIRIQNKIKSENTQLEKLKDRLDKLKELREHYRSKRREIEEEWRKLSSEIVEGGGSKVLAIQMNIGEVKSKLTELNTKISSGKASLEGLKKIRENILRQHESLRKEIHDNRIRIRALRREYESILNEVKLKQAEHDSLANEAIQLWNSIGENSKRVREMEQQINRNNQRLAYLRSEQAKVKTAINIREQKLKDLNNRKERFIETIRELEKSLLDLEKVQMEQKAQLKSIESLLERKIMQKEAMEREISEADKIASSAREAVIEFATQRELFETVAIREKALRSIEELSELGVIRGVYGRLRKLIKIDDKYVKAIEAAAGEWLDAIVVKDFDAAFTCAETLRRMKLGRVKIIPLEGMSSVKPINPPEGENIEGAAFKFIKCAKQYEPAIHFVFGDTLVVVDGKTALELSSRGYRIVTIDGDVYEAGGALESGYYRAPIDFSAIVPSEAAIKSLDEAVRALQRHLSKRGEDIKNLEDEIDRIRVEIARLSEAIVTIDREINRVKRSIARTDKNVKRIEENTQRIEKEIEDERAKIWAIKAEKNVIIKELRKLQSELVNLKKKIDPANIQAMEVRREKLAEEIIALRQKLGAIQTEISTLQSQFENILREGYRNAKIQLSRVDQQIKHVEQELGEALQEKEKLQAELIELERKRDELSKNILSAREESHKFTSQIDEIDKELRKLDAEYEETSRLFNGCQLSIQTSLIQLEQWQKQLKHFGYEEPLAVTQKEVEEAEATLRMLKFELERIGAVNQLAVPQYDEQISRYKELSIKINELEKEKQAILKFMEEIESKKKKVFMEAFEKINHNLQRYFSKLTGGGTATLMLENPEDPFAEGIEMIVHFPMKPAIIVSGASGGERSVAAVAFIFALKDFTPATFYILDEVDAHLDAFHVSKLADLLLEEAEKAQFVVITLKPEMVNKAQKVYGVYAVNGVSNIIEAKFLEAKS